MGGAEAEVAGAGHPEGLLHTETAGGLEGELKGRSCGQHLGLRVGKSIPGSGAGLKAFGGRFAHPSVPLAGL